MRPSQHRGAEHLRGLHRHEVVARHRGGHDAGGVDTLDGVGDGDGGHRRVGAGAHRGDRGVEHGGVRQRPRGVVHGDDLHVVGHRGEAGGDTGTAVRTARHDRDDPVGTDVHPGRGDRVRVVRRHDDRAPRRCAQGDGATQDGDPVEVTELLGDAVTGADSPAAGTDDGPDVVLSHTGRGSTTRRCGRGLP